MAYASISWTVYATYLELHSRMWYGSNLCKVLHFTFKFQSFYDIY